MNKNNLMTLKRDCLIAMLVPLLSLGLFQVAFNKFSALGMGLLAVVGAVLVYWCLRRFSRQLDDMAWQQQLNAVVQNISAPVIIADLNHTILFTNEHFQQLPIATALGHLDNIVDMLAIHENKLDNNVEELLTHLTGKLNCHLTWDKQFYVCTLHPLLSPSGKRFGTLLECKVKPDMTVTEDDFQVLPTKIDQKIAQSQEQMKALENKVECLERNSASIENELRKFTQGMLNAKLYQKANEGKFDSLDADNFTHPLLKNSSKLILELRTDLQDSRTEIDELKSEHEKEKSTNLQQLNILSNSICRNVNEARHDFGAMHQEIIKLKGLLNEQKGLNQAYVKPIGKAYHFAEKALLQTVDFSETVTLISQQMHENQSFIGQLHTFMSKFAQTSKKSSDEKSNDVYQDIASLLDRVKNALSLSKLRLTELLVHFEGLSGSWKEAQDNLNLCVHLGTAIEQSSKRWESITDLANGHSQQIHGRIEQLRELTQKMHEKTSASEVILVAEQNHENVTRQFEQVVIEMDDTKKRAEDVLFEGIS